MAYLVRAKIPDICSRATYLRFVTGRCILAPAFAHWVARPSFDEHLTKQIKRLRIGAEC